MSPATPRPALRRLSARLQPVCPARADRDPQTVGRTARPGADRLGRGDQRRGGRVGAGSSGRTDHAVAAAGAAASGLGLSTRNGGGTRRPSRCGRQLATAVLAAIQGPADASGGGRSIAARGPADTPRTRFPADGRSGAVARTATPARIWQDATVEVAP